MVAALLFASLPAAAASQSANVVVTVDQQTYAVGGIVNVTMRVFNFGVPIDATSLDLRLNPRAANERFVNVTRQSVGLYNATFQIRTTDVSSSGNYSEGSVQLEVDSVVESLIDHEFATVSVLPPNSFGFSLASSSYTALPGSAVNLSLRTTANGVPHDADLVAISVVGSAASGVYGPVSLSVTNVSTGNYSAVLPVPTSLSSPALLYVIATATLSNATATRTAFVSVPGAQPFEVWQYLSSFAPPVVQFTIFVGDRSGGFVEGANVSLNYTFSSVTLGLFSVTRPASAITDAYGRATFGLNLSGATDVFDVAYRGNVTKDTQADAFSGLLFPTSTSAPSFEIMRTNPFAFFDVNATAQLNYTVLAFGTPVSGVRVYYYMQTDTEFLGAGNVTSDASGDFTVAVPMRAGGVHLLLTARSGGTSWLNVMEDLFPFHPLEVQASPVRMGTTAQVNVTFPSPGTWYTVVYLMPYGSLFGTSPWSPVSALFGPASSFQTGTGVTFNLSLPRFLPKDTDYLLYASSAPAASISTGAPSETYAYSRVIHVTNLPAQVRENLSTTSPAVGDVVTADASSSFDSDGYIVGYRMTWGDGNLTDWSSSPVFSHAFAAPGDYMVSMSAKDDTGAVSITQEVVHVEATFLGLRASLALPVFVAVALVAVALAVVFRSRRRRRPMPSPPSAEPLAEPAAAMPTSPEEPRPPPEAP